MPGDFGKRAPDPASRIAVTTRGHTMSSGASADLGPHPETEAAATAHAHCSASSRDAPAGNRTWIYRLGGGRLIRWTTRARSAQRGTAQKASCTPRARPPASAAALQAALAVLGGQACQRLAVEAV